VVDGALLRGRGRGRRARRGARLWRVGEGFVRGWKEIERSGRGVRLARRLVFEREVESVWRRGEIAGGGGKAVDGEALQLKTEWMG